MNALPHALVNAAALGTWPSGSLPGALFARVAPFAAQMRFDLLTLEQVRGHSRSKIADTRTLVEFSAHPASASTHRLYAGRNANGPMDLPWLDVEKATVIGGGADFGDDTWIALDYRQTPEAPRVVISTLEYNTASGRTAEPARITWLELAANVSNFLEMIHPRPK